MSELLAPCGNMQKLKTAVHFGADAVYFGGAYSLRAFAGNFSAEEIGEAMNYLHARGKKGYITLNIFAKNADFGALTDYVGMLARSGVDAVIVSDIGVIQLIQKTAPQLEIHLSTQANTTNRYAARFWAELGIQRIVLARELSLIEIAEIRDTLPKTCELEAFIHGAMCISYSGRCLLSNYLSGRDSNRGECVQACRWDYEIREKSRTGAYLGIEEDGRGTYILNSRDLNMLCHLQEMQDAGIQSFKIEGRMKSEYYVGTVVCAYRKVLDALKKDRNYVPSEKVKADLYKMSHRAYTTAYMLGNEDETEYYLSSRAEQTYEFSAMVNGYDKLKECLVVEQRNRFQKGDELEIVSTGPYHDMKFVVSDMWNERGESVDDAKLVQEKLWIACPYPLTEFDMLRKCLPNSKIISK